MFIHFTPGFPAVVPVETSSKQNLGSWDCRFSQGLGKPCGDVWVAFPFLPYLLTVLFMPASFPQWDKAPRCLKAHLAQCEPGPKILHDDLRGRNQDCESDQLTEEPLLIGAGDGAQVRENIWKVR